MTQKDKEIAGRFKRLVAERLRVEEVLVFGSRARDEAEDDSDLDIMVILPETNREWEKYISDCAWEAGFPDDVVVMPLVLTVDDVQNSPIRASVFLRRVRQEGVAV